MIEKDIYLLYVSHEIRPPSSEGCEIFLAT